MCKPGYISPVSTVNCHICQLYSFEVGSSENARSKTLISLNYIIIYSNFTVVSCLDVFDSLTMKTSTDVSCDPVFLSPDWMEAAGGESQLPLISSEGSCVAKTRQLPSSWLRRWEPTRKGSDAVYTIKSLCTVPLSLPFSYRFVLSHSFLPLFLFHSHKNTAESHQTVNIICGSVPGLPPEITASCG